MSLNAEELVFITKAQKDARKAFRVLRETRTIAASGTISFVQRIPASDKLVTLGYGGPWAEDPDEAQLAVFGLDNRLFLGQSRLGGDRYTSLFREFADLQNVSHVHSPYLGAYSQAHLPMPLLYVPNRRFRKAKELPVWVDRRQPEDDFIAQVIRQDKEIPGVVEANGGTTVWSFAGLLELANDILLLEEGALFQILAASALGHSKPFGPGVLTQQWRMGKLIPKDATVDENETIHLAAAAE